MKRRAWFWVLLAMAPPSLLPAADPPVQFGAVPAGGSPTVRAVHAARGETITNSIGMKLTKIAAGEFMMGSGESSDDTTALFNGAYGVNFLKAESFSDEHPQHRVRITRPFYLGTFHVTRGQFRQFVNDAGYKTDAEKGTRPGAFGWDPEKKTSSFSTRYSWRDAGFAQTDEHPVVNVSWNDSVAFCQWLSLKDGKDYQLPTEAQWEYACRAGTTTRYYSGDDPESVVKVGNVPDATYKATFPHWHGTIKGSDGYVFTAPIGSFQPNDVGLYDMHGNAEQWCSDRYGADYYATSPLDDPTGSDTGNSRVARGGCWQLRPDHARSAARARLPPDNRLSFTGFRVASTGLPAEVGKELPKLGGKPPPESTSEKLSQFLFVPSPPERGAQKSELASPDGKVRLDIQRYKIQLIDVASGEFTGIEFKLDTSREADEFTCAAFSPNGTYVVTGTACYKKGRGDDRDTNIGQIQVWDATTGAFIMRGPFRIGSIRSLRFKDDNKAIYYEADRFSLDKS